MLRPVALLLLLAPTLAPAAPSSRPPNIVLVLADDLGAAELGCYGNATRRTPNLDRLAGEGMRFETCYATPLCTPTRVALMTGRFGFRTGYFQMLGSPLTPSADSPAREVGANLTFADVLKAAGYATAMAGKWQLTGSGAGLVRDCGFDSYRMWAYEHNLPPGVMHTGAYEGGGRTARYWNPAIVEDGKYLPTKPDDYGPDLFADFLLDFAKARRDGPFLLYFTMPLTHGPHLETPDPARPGARLPGGFPSNLEYLDHLMGRFVRALDAVSPPEDTVLIFVGDNGTAGRGKGEVTERGVRVPLFVRAPGRVPAGTVSRALVSVTDLFPTMAELAGATVPAGHTLDGRSLVPVLSDPAAAHRPWTFSYLGRGKVLRDGRWLLERAGDGSERLFDCGEARDGAGYREVTDSDAPEVEAARARFATILEDLPGPESRTDLIPPRDPAQPKADAQEKARRKAARQSRRELDRHQGVWRAVSSVREGKDGPPDVIRSIVRTVEGDHVTWSRDGKAFAGTTIELDPAADPPALDVLPDGGRARGRRVLGIYKLDGNTLTIAMADPGGPRPTSFASAPGSRITVQTFRREDAPAPKPAP
jgi:arylsulfatase A